MSIFKPTKYVFAWLVLITTCWSAPATDVAGVWATDARNCDKVFVKKGRNVSFAKDADLYGSGFIIEGRTIRGRAATCTIRSTREDGATVHFIAACATDIMLSNVQLSLKVVDHNKVIRIFPGVADMEMPYERCGL